MPDDFNFETQQETIKDFNIVTSGDFCIENEFLDQFQILLRQRTILLVSSMLKWVQKAKYWMTIRKEPELGEE